MPAKRRASKITIPVSTPKADTPASGSRTRGRPKNSKVDAAPVEGTTPVKEVASGSRTRGRPKNSEVDAAPVEETTPVKQVASGSRTRGRPKKSEVDSASVEDTTPAKEVDKSVSASRKRGRSVKTSTEEGNDQ